MKDKHLNLFWHYGKQKPEEELTSDLKIEYEKNNRSINQLENNITRSTIITFNSLQSNNKIIFLNKLIGKDALLKNKSYEYSYELQSQAFKEEILQSDTIHKYLIGFCPDGTVKNGRNYETDQETIVSVVDKQEIKKEPNPDGCIIVKNNSRIVLVVVFENKKESLYPDQLHRHLVKYLGVKSAKDHLIIKNYTDFYGIFDSFKETDKNSYCGELLEYLNYLSLYTPTLLSVKEIYDLYKNDNLYSPEEMKRAADGALGSVLSEVLKDKQINFGKLRVQKGWGNIIDVTKQCSFIKMIGLVWDKNSDEIILNIKFASNMDISKLFYKKYDVDLIKNNPGLFKTSFMFEAYGHYIGETWYEFTNVDKYFSFFKNKIENNNYHSVGGEEVKMLLNEMNEQIEPFDVEAYLRLIKTGKNGEDKTAYAQNQLGYVPSLEIVKKWSIEEAIKLKQDFINQICSIIKRAKPYFGIK